MEGIPYFPFGQNKLSEKNRDVRESLDQGPGEGLIIAVVEHGGHLGFAEDLLPINTSYIDRLCIDWFNAVLEVEATGV